MDERSACVKADPKRIREVFKRGERIKGISRSIEIRNRTRLARLLHAKIEGKQRRKVGEGEEKNENSTRDKVSLQKSSPPLCNHDHANIHRDRWIRIEMEILARFFRISRWVMEGSREGTGGRRGKSDDSIFANVTPRRFNFHTRKRWGGGTGIYDRILARWLDASIDWVAIELNTGAGGNGQSFLDRVYEIHGC